jgi:ribosomal protein L12E/L44/L45/RPP1/RPP2
MTGKVVNYKQLGTTGLRRYGQYVYEEFMPELRWPWAGKIYQEMADNDPVIGSILYLAEMLIRGTKVRVVPGGETDADKAAAAFLLECLHDMDMSWANTISEVLSMLSYGFSFHEIVYKVRRGPTETNPKYRSKYTDGRIGWRRMPVRSQMSLHEWTFDEDGDVVAFVQRAEPDYRLVTIPMAKGMLFRTRMSRDNPEGKSLLRNAYRPWFFKKHFEEIEGIGIERDLAGFPVLTAPEGLDLWEADNPAMVALKTKAEELVSSVRRDSEEGVLLPYGWDLSLLTSGSSRQIDIGATIDRYDNRIAITLLSDIVLIGSTKAGSFALADTKQSMLAAALQAQLQNIADVFNSKAVADLFLFNNFPGITANPCIEFDEIQTPSLKELALVLRAMGLNIAGDKELQNHLRQILGAPDLDDELFEETYKPQSAEAVAAAAKEASDAAADAAKDAADLAAKTDEQDDTAENDLEGSDQVATPGGD